MRMLTESQTRMGDLYQSSTIVGFCNYSDLIFIVLRVYLKIKIPNPISVNNKLTFHSWLT